jgi:hypothetical protein
MATNKGDGQYGGLQNVEVDPVAMHHHRSTDHSVEQGHRRHRRTPEAGDERPNHQVQQRRDDADERCDDDQSERVGQREPTDLETVVAGQSLHRVVRGQRQDAHGESAAPPADDGAADCSDDDGGREQPDDRFERAPPAQLDASRCDSSTCGARPVSSLSHNQQSALNGNRTRAGLHIPHAERRSPRQI